MKSGAMLDIVDSSSLLYRLEQEGKPASQTPHKETYTCLSLHVIALGHGVGSLC